jgi:hypothetical protein
VEFYLGGNVFGVILLSNLAATLMMTGLIWFVQIVHYPLFAVVGTHQFWHYQRAHSRFTSWVVGPIMLIEAATAVGLVSFAPQAVPVWAAWSGVGLVAVIWLSTVALQIPCHSSLAVGFDAMTHERLVRTNWIRTVGWTLRSTLVLVLVGLMIGKG